MNSLLMAKNAVTWFKRQGLKVSAATPSYLPSLYSPKTWWPNLETMVVGGAKAIKNLANQTMNPWLLRQSEFFKHAGLQPQQLAILERNPKLISNILNDPKSWASGKVGIAKPMKRIRGKNVGKKYNVYLTNEAKAMVNPLQKDLHAQLYFMQGNLNRTGIEVNNKVAVNVFNKLYGQNLSRAGANRLVGNKHVLDDIIRYEKLDPNKLKYMEMYKHQLNGLHRDMQFSQQFRRLSEATHGRKFKSKNELASFLVSNGFEPGQVRSAGQYIMVNYAPKSASNFYTGGINGRVLIRPSDPGKAILIPNDVYNIFSSNFDDFITKAVGLKNKNLNLMGMKKIDIPDPSNWGKHFTNVEKQIAKKIKVRDDNIKKAVKNYSKPKSKVVITPETINRHTRLTKAQLEGNEKILQSYKDTPITPGRVAKLGAAYAGTAGAGYGAYSYITSDSDIDGEYDGTK